MGRLLLAKGYKDSMAMANLQTISVNRGTDLCTVRTEIVLPKPVLEEKMLFKEVVQWVLDHHWN